MLSAASSTVLGEVLQLITVMRRNRRWKSAPYDVGRNLILLASAHVCWCLQSREQAGDALAAFVALRSDVSQAMAAQKRLNLSRTVSPFVDVILSPETGGVITGAALAALHKFIAQDLFGAAHWLPLRCCRRRSLLWFAVHSEPRFAGLSARRLCGRQCSDALPIRIDRLSARRDCHSEDPSSSGGPAADSFVPQPAQ
jgi:hypothetical protein